MEIKAIGKEDGQTRKISFEGKDQGSVLDMVCLICFRQPRGDAEMVIRYMSLEFRGKVLTGNINLRVLSI